MDGLDMSQLFTVEGLVCVVTGGGTGIGLCIFRFHLARLMADISAALAQNGATVYIVGRRKEKLETAVKMHKSVSSTFTSHLTEAHERKVDPPCCRCHIQR
jgi:NADP-dependent 3-hydroxy acid dehydrogenase YdfG